jgi:HD superfamily phosphohydrolase
VLDDNNSIKQKLFKDPIYGYISIPCDFVYTFIDTSVFQRLRHIVQTSYSPLYPTALHNRFVHSLGVYHLGSLAFENIIKSLKDTINEKSKTSYSIDEQNINEYKTIFLAACLLHDVGHAPFSHIGEKFYENTPNNMPLLDQFWEAAGLVDANYKSQDPRKRTPANHELMSVIVALREFKSFFINKDKEFFSRCITGYEYDVSQYDKKLKFELQLKNSLISILNSDLIDVDRLDYLIRDSFVSGYQNVSIDYKRLLNNLVFVYDKKEDKYILAFHKNAVSIIDSLIFAHDSEKKWIQYHPIICYETEIIKYAIRKVINHFDKKNIFCFEALIEEGIVVKTKLPSSVEYKISLLSDTEILFFIKILSFDDDFLKEYFDRSKRRSALWKSEVEFTHLYNSKLSREAKYSFKSVCSSIINAFEGSLSNIPPIINEKAYLKAKNILQHPDDMYHNEELVSNIEEDRKNAIMKKITEFIEYCKCFKKFAKKNDLDFNKGFLILTKDKFTSNFSKEILKDIKIWLPSVQQIDVYPLITQTLKSTQPEESTLPEKEKLVYFYIENINNDKKKRKIQENFFSFVGNELKNVYDKLI